MSAVPERLSAALADRYALERQLGEGGMATVYLAHDVKHDRRVAIKVLRPELAAVVGGERFIAEIRTTANLRHPHILPLFDSGEDDGFLWYAMPYVEGESLRDRLDREKQLPVAEAVEIARKVSGALQAAHDAGVVHRDIKPGNILLERDEPVVADFGIALAVSAAGQGRLTETGLSLGTPHYMSPEQATADRAPDARSDQYALACVLYEMLSGDPPFTGSSVQGILVRILTEPPRDVSAARASVPAHVAGAVRKAMEKLPADRFDRLADFAAALADPGFRYEGAHREGLWNPLSGPGAGAAAGPGWRRAVPWALAALFAGTSLVLALGDRSAREGATPSIQALLDLGGIEVTGSERVEIARTGDRFVVAGRRNGLSALYFRRARDDQFVLLPGTDGATDPTFSPDGSQVVFATPGGLGILDVTGGSPRRLSDEGRSPAWMPDGRIAFRSQEGLAAVPATGGSPVTLSQAAAGLFDVTILEGGRSAVGSTRSTADGSGVLFVDLERDTAWTMVEGGMSARVLDGGRLLYADGAGDVWLVSFDPARGLTSGTPARVVEGVGVRNGYFAMYSVSDDGTLVLTRGAPEADLPGLGYLSLDGAVEPVAGPDAGVGEPVWDPTGERIAFWGGVGDRIFGASLGVMDVLGRTKPAALTSEGDARRPIWSPDGTRIAYAGATDDRGGADLMVIEATGGPARPLVAMPQRQAPTDWPVDSLVFFDSGPVFGGGEGELWVANLADPDSVRVRRYLAPSGGARRAVLDPSGRWVAYNAVREDRVEVRSFPEPREAILISDFSSGRPAWSATGDTLFFWSYDERARESLLYAAVVERGAAFRMVDRFMVTRGRFASSYSGPQPGRNRFIVHPYTAFDENGAPVPVAPEDHVVITGWLAGVEAALREEGGR